MSGVQYGTDETLTCRLQNGGIMGQVINNPDALFGNADEGGSSEWYTPKYILERVLKVMGGIDLDPCAEKHTHEGPNVPARWHITKAEDGLKYEWHGRVFANPPYGRCMREWAQKFIEEYKSGRMTEGILLAHARTDTVWYSYVSGVPVCFIRGRLRFSDSKNTAPFPSALFYVGPDPVRFAQVFNDLGSVYQPFEEQAA